MRSSQNRPREPATNSTCARLSRIESKIDAATGRIAERRFDYGAEPRKSLEDEIVSEAVTDYIETVGQKPGQEWQAPVCEALRAMTLTALPGAEERMQYAKPHYLVDKTYAAVIGTARQHVSYTIFNAAELDPPAGLFEDGPPERRTIKIKKDQTVDYAQLGDLLRRAAATMR